MKLQQFLFLKLMEECNEVSQISSKCSQFGMEECYKDGPNNAERTCEELNDEFAMILLLNKLGLRFKIDPDKIDKKIKKVLKYLEHSVNLGEIDESVLLEYKGLISGNVLDGIGCIIEEVRDEKC